MKQFFKIFIISHLLLLSISCEKEVEKPLVNFTIFFQAECQSEMVFICVNEDEFRRIQKLSELNDAILNPCLAITITDLDGKIHEGILLGYSGTSEDIPCNQTDF